MKRAVIVVIMFVGVGALACTTTGCASNGPYDDQFVTQRDDKGKPTEWVIGPSKRAPKADKQFVSRPAI